MTKMTKSEKAVAETNAARMKPAYMRNDDVGRGSEHVSADDVVIPRLDVIQDLSPQRKKSQPEYIEGAETGLLFNTVTGQLYGADAVFVPVYFRKEYVIWKDRKAGGGFNGSFATVEAAQDAMNQGNLDPMLYGIVDTAQQFGLIVDNPTSEKPQIEEVVISCSRSKMKPSRKLNSMIRMNGGDRWERAFRIRAVEMTNQEGQLYQNLDFSEMGFVSEEVYNAGEKTYNAIVGGQRSVAMGDAE